MTKMLRLYSVGDDVVRLQKKLNDALRLVPPLKLDGKFGQRTASAVRAFQASVGLSIDGVVGPKTWNALDSGLKLSSGMAPPVLSFANAPWLEIAKREEGQGVSEVVGIQHNPRIIEYHSTTNLRASSDEVPWCSSFVNWCLKQVGVSGTNSALAVSWLNWGVATVPKPGAITVIYNAGAVNSSTTATGNHVGFLIQETSSHVFLLGGNQSNRVKVSRYPKAVWLIKGHRWPA